MDLNYESLVQKWAPVLNEESAGEIKDAYRRKVTAAILENQEQAFAQEAGASSFLHEAAAANNTSSAANWNPVLISLVRRSMPNLMAYDICGVQPMSGPTGLIFAMKSRYKSTQSGATSGDEALFNEAVVPYSGDSSTTHTAGPSGLDGLTDSNVTLGQINTHPNATHTCKDHQTNLVNPNTFRYNPIHVYVS